MFSIIYHLLSHTKYYECDIVNKHTYNITNQKSKEKPKIFGYQTSKYTFYVKNNLLEQYDEI